MDPERFEYANSLWRDGHVEDAASEFHAMAEEADYSDEKAGLLINEHKCYAQVGKLDKANEVMRQIRNLTVHDKFVRMIVDFGDACMTTQMGKLEEGVFKFGKILETNWEELRDPDNRHLYEDLQERRGFALTSLERYPEALPILNDALSFTSDKSDPQLVHFYLAVCYQATSQMVPAKESFLRAIQLGLSSDFEAGARYRLGILYFRSGALAQAKYHLEVALQLPKEAIKPELRKNIYQQMSQVCHYLREFKEEKKYSKLAQVS